MSGPSVLALAWGVTDGRGGGEPVLSYELVRHLGLLGAQVDVVTPMFECAQPMPPTVRVTQVRGGTRPGHTGRNKSAMLAAARRLVRERRYDVVHLVSQFTSFPVVARPFVVSGCHVEPSASPRCSPARRLLSDLVSAPAAHRADLLRDVAWALQMERGRGWTRASTLRAADAVIVRQSAGVDALTASARRVVHIPLGVDLEAFPFCDGPREPRVVFAGNLRPYKNVDGLLHAFRDVAARMPHAVLVVLGDGPERQRLEALAETLGIAARTEFRGAVPRTGVAAELARAAVLCLPSHSESFGQVALEAFATGTPAVVSERIPGARDYLEHGRTGFLVPPERPEAIADALLSVLSDPAAARAMGAAARAAAERFSMEKIARLHLALYARLAGDRQRPRAAGGA